MFIESADVRCISAASTIACSFKVPSSDEALLTAARAVEETS